VFVEFVEFADFQPRRLRPSHSFPTQRTIMVVTVAELSPIVALVAGILILIVPRLLNIIVAVYLIVEGLIGLNAIHHFFR
jgi:Protein of unknown function (DUF3096)